MNSKSLLFTICLAAILVGASSAQADEPLREVLLIVNELKIFPVYELSRVAVGDPEVADVTVLSERELLLMAKKAGTSSLIIWDEAGQRAFNITVIEKDLEKEAMRIRGLLASSDIREVRVKIEGDKVYAVGEVLTELELEKVKDALAPFADAVNLVKLKERQPLVEIDVNVLEVGLDDLKKLGVDWTTSLPISYTEGASEGGKAPKLWRAFYWDRGTVIAKLNFLIEEGKARTLSNPKLITLSGKQASFLVGGEVPYVIVESDGRTSVEWKEYGVNIKIEPIVNSKNEIKTKIETEVSDLDWNVAVSQENNTIPALKKRKAQTELFLNEDDTVFLAGLIKDEDRRNVARLPWLSKVPILGELFKSTEFQDKRTELVISITPRLIGEKANPDYLNSEMAKQETILSAQRRFPAYSEESSPLAYYSHMIEDIIAKRVVYPPQAHQEQQEGIVQVDLYLLANGELRDAQIKQSSGYSILDQAALLAVQEQSPYPAFPAEITQQELRLTVPVVFKNYVKNE